MSKTGRRFSSIVFKSGSVPLNPADGEVWYDSTGNTFKFRQNNSNVELGYLIDEIAALKAPVPSASYWMNNNTTASPTIPIGFGSKEYDVYNNVSVFPSPWRFTSSKKGLYIVKGFLYFAGPQVGWIQIYKGGVAYKTLTVFNTFLGGGAFCSDIRLAVGEYMDLRPNTTINFSGQPPLSDITTSNVSITWVGGY
ncbi:MAG: hypothetical protein IPN68_09845 [Bacteroidetes bacterium]|nr:hypothetical protein [Bacteroidota bacterium]